jgi:hypothetical protein
LDACCVYVATTSAAQHPILAIPMDCCNDSIDVFILAQSFHQGEEVR